VKERVCVYVVNVGGSVCVKRRECERESVVCVCGSECVCETERVCVCMWV